MYATAFHEPENDLTAAEFVAFQRHVYTVVKAANPTILWGPVYMAYWWDPSKPDHYVGNPAAWWPGDRYADFVASGRPVTEDAVLQDLRRRDQIDREREVSPLRPADDAVKIDTDGLTQQQVLERVLRLIERAK